MGRRDREERWIVRAEPQAERIRNRESARVLLDDRNRISRADLARRFDAEVEPAAIDRRKAIDHVGPTEPDAQLEARHARLRDDELRGADAESVADADDRFDQTRRR